MKQTTFESLARSRKDRAPGRGVRVVISSSVGLVLKLTTRETSSSAPTRGVAKTNADDDWIIEEVGETAFADERLGKRFRALLGQLSPSPGESIAVMC